MDPMVMLFILLWRSGLQAEPEHNTAEPDVRLVGGASHCAGRLEVKHLGHWRPVDAWTWTLQTAAVVCRQMDCGSAVSIERRQYSYKPVWGIYSECVESGSPLRECRVEDTTSSSINEVVCSESVRLLNGTSLCSGTVQVKTNQSWASVCQADFDQQEAQVLCRELGCGPPSLLQGALYGEVEAPLWTKEFQCEGNESLLLDCRTSGSTRNTCDKAVHLTCSEPDSVMLVGGASHCAGRLEMKHLRHWRPVDLWEGPGAWSWSLKIAAVVCRQIDCGSAVSTKEREDSDKLVWEINPYCLVSGSPLRECEVVERTSSSIYEVVCSESVRLLNGTSVCSGRVQVKTNQSWASVCQADFDQQEAQVLCRELGCGPPSLLQGALYGEVEAPLWTKEFQCEGNESLLLDCRTSGSTRNTCDKAVHLTCSEPDVRLVGGASRCAGRLEVKHLGHWRPVEARSWTLKTAAVVCRQMDCGSAVSTEQREDSDKPAWRIDYDCVESGSPLRECGVDDTISSFIYEMVCSDLLLEPNISLSSSTYGVSQGHQQEQWLVQGSIFTISCSVQYQYPGGSFTLTFNGSSMTHNYTQTAVNHSAYFTTSTPEPAHLNQTPVNHVAHFPFPPAEPAHQGEYRCAYHLHVFSHNFSSESQALHLTVTASPVPFYIIRLSAFLLLCTAALCSCYTAPRRHNPR